MLQWVLLQHCFLSELTCSEAAAGGHLVVLQWAREQACHWNVGTCTAAASNGHLVVLQYAHQNGCSPWRPPGSVAVCPPERLCLGLDHL